MEGDSETGLGDARRRRKGREDLTFCWDSGPANFHVAPPARFLRFQCDGRPIRISFDLHSFLCDHCGDILSLYWPLQNEFKRTM